MAKFLSKRLQTVATLVDDGCFLADVGADHAQLPIALVSSGKIRGAMAIENKTGPYLHMCSAVGEAQLEERIVCSKSDGISALREDVNEIALCGMGGLLSCAILEAHPEKLRMIQSIIMDPHRDLDAVRSRVSQLGFYLADEVMIKEDGIYYSIMKFNRGMPKKPYDFWDLAFGPILRMKREPIFLEWLAEQKNYYAELLNKNLSAEAKEKYTLLYRGFCAELVAPDNSHK